MCQHISSELFNELNFSETNESALLLTEQKELTCDLCCSPCVLADIGVETDGDEFEAGVTGREVHFCQLEEMKFAERGLPGTTL